MPPNLTWLFILEKTLLSLISIATGSQKQKKYDDQFILL